MSSRKKIDKRLCSGKHARISREIGAGANRATRARRRNPHLGTLSNPSESDSEDVISTDLLCFLLRVVLYGIINGP